MKKNNFNLKNAVPWGRSFHEYKAMFDLTDADLACRILGCGDGPAAFNAQCAAHGGKVVSIDPMYRFSAPMIKNRIDDVARTVIEQTRLHEDMYVWDQIRSPDELYLIRMDAMRTFLKDYPDGRMKNRYLAAGLPHLPFRDNAFDLALCSHFLFLYSDRFSFDFHLQSIWELCRVSRQVRIFPLLDLQNRPSKYVVPLVSYFEQHFPVAVEKVPYAFQKGADRMMKLICEHK